jgi:hypothetical protein
MDLMDGVFDIQFSTKKKMEFTIGKFHKKVKKNEKSGKKQYKQEVN